MNALSSLLDTAAVSLFLISILVVLSYPTKNQKRKEHKND